MAKKWLTIINAIDPITDELKEWMGPMVVANSWEEAEQYCKNKLGYCKIHGELIGETPYSTAEYTTLLTNNLN